MGWHYSVQKASCISVSEYWPRVRENASAIEALAALIPRGYTAFLNLVGNLPGGRWTGEGSTPEEAVADVLCKLHAERAELDKIVDALANEMDRGS